MQKWIGNRPTIAQKALSRYETLLFQSLGPIISSNEQILKVIEAECDKRNGRELKGVLVLTSGSFVFLSKSEHMVFFYNKISDVDVRTDGKDKNEWQLTMRIGRSKRTFDDIKKNDDSHEFVEILEHKIVHPHQEILTTVTHNFDVFLHAERLEDLRNRQVKITSFLMKRDDMGLSKNGERLLREKHKNADLIVEGYFQEGKQKKGNFIVVDQGVLLYEYDNKERRAKLIKSWAFYFFSQAGIDHFALKSEILTEEGTLVLNSAGKAFADILRKANVPLNVKKRKWYQKILGFRSGKWWKRSIASIVYLFMLLIVLAIAFGDDTTETDTVDPTNNVADNNANEKAEREEEKQVESERIAEEQRQREEADRVAEEQRKQEEFERIAEEQRQQEEAERLAEEQRKQAETERIAEEQRQQEEADRVAQEQRQQEEAAKQTNVYYKNCTEARNAGAAPVRKGEPGYGKHLDRDGDGIGCDT